MRKHLLFLVLFMLVNSMYAADRTVTIEIRNVLASSGKVYVAVYNSEKAYKNQDPIKSYVLESKSAELAISDKIADGEYVVSIFQDLNDNGKLDTNLLGIPKEPVGISNYSGKGIPGGFEDLKLLVKKDNQIIIVSLRKI